MRHFLLYIVIFSACLLCRPCAAEITVALVAPRAEDYVQQGDELTKGVQKAIDEINKNGGILGEKIDLLSIDDQCNDSIAISTAQMLSILKNKQIKLVIGPYCANSFDKVTEIYAQAKMFQIIPTTVNYTQAKTIQKGLVKMLGYTNQQAKDFFIYYNQTFAGQNLAIVTNPQDDESMEETRALQEEFQRHGKSVVLMQYNYDAEEKQYAKMAKQIMHDGNQLAFLLGTPRNIRKMARALKDENPDFIIFTNKYAATKEYFDYLGGKADGTYMMELRGRNDDPDFAETLVKLRLSGFDVEGLSVYGYSAVKLWESLVKNAKSFDYNKLSAAVNDKNIRTEFGNHMFHNGAPKVSESYAIYRYYDEHFHKVY